MPNDPKKIAEWEQLADAAPVGPWRVDDERTEFDLEPLGITAFCRSIEIIGPEEADGSVVIIAEHREPIEEPTTGVKSTFEFIAAAREAVPALLAEREELLALLQEIEWSGTEDGQEVCPACRGHREPPPGDLSAYGARHGHAPDCRIDA